MRYENADFWQSKAKALELCNGKQEFMHQTALYIDSQPANSSRRDYLNVFLTVQRSRSINQSINHVKYVDMQLQTLLCLC